ncbi:5660_t:CDS:1, partial [Gigaspora rosea]
HKICESCFKVCDGEQAERREVPNYGDNLPFKGKYLVRKGTVSVYD